MKKTMVSLVMVGIMVSLLFSGCKAPASTNAEKKVKIGVALASEAQYRFKFDQQIMKQKADELGAEIIFQFANYEAGKQENQVENLISQEIDVLILNVVSGNMVNLVNKVKAQGIPVITFDNTVEGAEVDLNVDRDNVKVGRLQMEAALEYTKNKGGNFVLVKGDPGSAVAQRISQGYDQVAAKHPEIHIVANQFHEAWSPDKALKTVENALSANHDDIQAFICSADSVAMGIVPAVKAAKLDGKSFICGMDVEVSVAKLIQEDIITMSIWSDIVTGDQRTVEAAVKLAKGEAVTPDEIQKIGGLDVPVLLVDVMPITKENLKEWINNIAPEGWITEEDVFGSN